MTKETLERLLAEQGSILKKCVKSNEKLHRICNQVAALLRKGEVDNARALLASRRP